MCVMIQGTCVGCAHTHTHTKNHYVNYELFVLGGNLSGAVTVKGIPVLGTAGLPYQEWEQIA